MAELDRLVDLYKELKLPIPPAEAPLVSVSDGGICVGYLLSRNGKNVRIQYGTVVRKAHFFQEPTLARVTKQDVPEFRALGAPFEQDSQLAFAVIERTRGNDEFALRILGSVSRGPFFDLGFTPFPRPPKNGSLEFRMRYLALQHWMNLVVDLETERSVVLSGLKDLIQRFPELENEFVASVIQGLDATIRDRYAGTDKVERLIDDLCDVQVTGRQLDSPDPTRAPEFDPLLRIIEEGYGAIPVLLTHAQDKRLTRAWDGRHMKASARFVTVGEVCTQLASHLAAMDGMMLRQGDYPVEIDRWWQGASKLTDRENCVAGLRASIDGRVAEGPIRWAEKHAPDLLLDRYREIVKVGGPLWISNLLSALARSKIDRGALLKAVVEGAGAKSWNHASASLYALHALHQGEYDTALLNAIRTRPDIPKDEYFARQVAKCEVAEAWDALREAAKAASVGERLEIIQASGYAHHTPKAKLLFFKFLLFFFDDGSTEPKSQRFLGLATSRVQDLAACRAAVTLDMVPPQDGAVHEQWEVFRLKVKDEMAKALKS